MHTPAKTFTQRHGNPHTLLVSLPHPYFSIREASGSRRLFCVAFLYSLGGIIIIFTVVAEEKADFFLNWRHCRWICWCSVALSDENKLLVLVFFFFLLEVENCSRSYAQTGEDGFQCKGLLLVCGQVLKRTRLQYGEEVGLGGNFQFPSFTYPRYAPMSGGVPWGWGCVVKHKTKGQMKLAQGTSTGALWTSA